MNSQNSSCLNSPGLGLITCATTPNFAYLFKDTISCQRRGRGQAGVPPSVPSEGLAQGQQELLFIVQKLWIPPVVFQVKATVLFPLHAQSFPASISIQVPSAPRAPLQRSILWKPGHPPQAIPPCTLGHQLTFPGLDNPCSSVCCGHFPGGHRSQRVHPSHLTLNTWTLTAGGCLLNERAGGPKHLVQPG